MLCGMFNILWRNAMNCPLCLSGGGNPMPASLCAYLPVNASSSFFISMKCGESSTGIQLMVLF